ncbi:MAG: Holliday junction resolvase RuvX, partial [Acidimicrobiia bacterium]
MARILGLDPGERRIGVAVSDPSGTIASPYDFIEVDDGEEIAAIVDVARQV